MWFRYSHFDITYSISKNNSLCPDISLILIYALLQATANSKLAGELEVIQSQLALCEKALAEYLETKRLAFPRFYFASSNDLLDILANGHMPIKVSKHLTKLFDSMAKLHLREKGEEKKSKFGLGQKTNKLKMVMAEAGGEDAVVQLSNNAFAMSAKDGEYVEFNVDCICEGQVEVWLNRLMSTMRSSIRYYYLFTKINILTKINNKKLYSVLKFIDVWIFSFQALYDKGCSCI